MPPAGAREHIQAYAGRRTNWDGNITRKIFQIGERTRLCRERSGQPLPKAETTKKSELLADPGGAGIYACGNAAEEIGF